MSEHGHGGHGHNEKAGNGNAMARISLAMGALLAFIAYGVMASFLGPTTTFIYPAAQPPHKDPPSVINGITPKEITADYPFDFEADGLVVIQYYRQGSFTYDPKLGKCQQFPQPKFLGPKKIWVKDSPTTGHVRFSITRTDGSPCPQ